MKVLVVEDEVSYRAPLVYQLMREGYEVEAASRRGRCGRPAVSVLCCST